MLLSKCSSRGEDHVTGISPKGDISPRRQMPRHLEMPGHLGHLQDVGHFADATDLLQVTRRILSLTSDEMAESLRTSTSEGNDHRGAKIT
ncbi:hypothetical protein BM1_09915 [Bipolaris maydis]|nr:hypothetical protein BM1_09915 [Bipolaris maydis]